VPSERGTRRDLATAAVIVLVMAVVAAAVLLSGSANRSHFRAADDEQPVYGPAVERPTSLQTLWSHASGGAGALEHFAPAVEAGADAVLAASVFHYGELTIGQVKDALRAAGHEVR